MHENDLFWRFKFMNLFSSSGINKHEIYFVIIRAAVLWRNWNYETADVV